jgi:mRNA interferase MazF
MIWPRGLRAQCRLASAPGYLAEALAEKLSERERQFIRSCKIANQDPEVLAIEREFADLPEDIQEPGRMPRRGEVWFVQLDPSLGSEIGKTRPCLVITSNIANDNRRTVVVIPLCTSPRASPPLLIPVVCAGRPAVAVLDQIRAVAKERLRERLGVLSTDNLRAVEDGLRQVLELTAASSA